MFSDIAVARPRLLILTDIGGDPDDTQSMVRLLVYSNHFNIVGLIATSRMGHGVDTQAHLIRTIVEDFALVRDNLQAHAAHAQLPPYPAAESLLRVIESGQPGVLKRPGEAESWVVPFGQGNSTLASRHIIAAADAASSADPLCISIWGGPADLAQALYDVRASRTPAEVADFVSRIRVCVSADQDGSGVWINREFPDLFYLHSCDVAQADGKALRFSASIRGMYQNDTPRNDGSAQQLVPSDQLHLVTRETVDRYIANPQQPLRRLYSSHAGNNWQRREIWRGPTGGFPNNGKGGTKEGDTPTWFYFLLNGLHLPTVPQAGGWGGRYRQGHAALHVPAGDRHWSRQAGGPVQQGVENCWAVARWRQEAFNDFAARLTWADSPVLRSAAHPPVITRAVTTPVGTIRSGQCVKLQASAADVDGRALRYRWWQYDEAGTLPQRVEICGDELPEVSFIAPSVQESCSLHIVLSVSNDAPLPLTSYRRFVIIIVPCAMRGSAGREGHFV